MSVERIDHLAGGGESDELDGNGEAVAELAREVDRNAARLTRRRVLRGENRIAEIDGGADLSGGGEVGDGGGRDHGLCGTGSEEGKERQDECDS
jgi:hypothetical protein